MLLFFIMRCLYSSASTCECDVNTEKLKTSIYVIAAFQEIFRKVMRNKSPVVMLRKRRRIVPFNRTTDRLSPFPTLVLPRPPPPPLCPCRQPPHGPVRGVPVRAASGPAAVLHAGLRPGRPAPHHPVCGPDAFDALQPAVPRHPGPTQTQVHKPRSSIQP